jgi:predicted TIM-barrel fold metal-dependent hydrolase
VIDGALVVDGVGHAYNFRTENRRSPEYADAVAAGVYGFHAGFQPRGRDDLVLSEQTFFNDICDAEVNARTMFAESHTDACVYHPLPLFGWFHDGGSPSAVGREMRERWPERVMLYGALSPHQPGALDELERAYEEDGVVGYKLYPHDLVAGELRTLQIDDPEIAYPLFERAEQLGVKVISLHKAVPFGQVPLAPYAPSDVGAAAKAFPNLTFEVVHGGFAFLEETAWLIQWYPNVRINLEGTSALLSRAPRKFAEIIGTIMMFGGAQRIHWAIGGPVVHSRAFEEAFWALEMPEELLERGLPELTREAKEDILALNLLRMLDVDPDALRAAIGGDEFAEPRELEPAWTAVRAKASLA